MSNERPGNSGELLSPRNTSITAIVAAVAALIYAIGGDLRSSRMISDLEQQTAQLSDENAYLKDRVEALSQALSNISIFRTPDADLAQLKMEVTLLRLQVGSDRFRPEGPGNCSTQIEVLKMRIMELYRVIAELAKASKIPLESLPFDPHEWGAGESGEESRVVVDPFGGFAPSGVPTPWDPLSGGWSTSGMSPLWRALQQDLLCLPQEEPLIK